MFNIMYGKNEWIKRFKFLSDFKGKDDLINNFSKGSVMVRFSF